jgi:hypothetical protein
VNEMIERVAMALFNSQTGKMRPTDPEPVHWRELNERGRNLWRKSACAAIAAMREPTGGMLIAARDWSIAKYGQEAGNDGATGCWRLMIDAALK